jgi:hypothetical protein
MRRCGRCVCVVVVPAQRGRGRGRQNIRWLPRALGPSIDDWVLCHWHILHPRRWKIWDLLPGSPSPPTARLARRLGASASASASGVLLIRCVHFVGHAVGLAGAYCCVFLIVCVGQGRSIGVVKRASFLIAGCAPRGCR